MSGHGKDAVRLCEHVVRQAFGGVVTRVASILLNRGRLPFPYIVRLAGLPRPTVAAALLLLMQHNLVLSNGVHLRTDPEGLEEMYEFAVLDCLHRLRWGRMLAMTQERLGSVAMEVVRMVMVYGKLTPGDVMRVTSAEGDGQRMAAVQEATVELVRNGLLQPTCPELHVIESDLIQRRFAAKKRQLIKDTGFTMPSAQSLADLQAKSAYEIETEREELRSLGRVLIKTPKVGKKKKAKEEFDYSLKPDVALRINNDRYGVLIRDELVVKAAEDRWNKGAAEVVRAVLAASLDEESTLKDTRTLADVGFNEIVERIPNKAHVVKVHGEIVRTYLAILAGEDQMLANGGAFLRREGSSSNPGFKVELESIAVRLRASLLSELVRQRLNDPAARVLAVVAKAQIASETTVRDCAMLPLREARKILSELQKMSIVETQEVPKTAAKMRTGLPSSAEYHLWQVDLPRVYNALLASVYKTIANAIQRKSAEVEKRKLVLDREARSMGVGGRDRLQQKDQEDLAELDGIVKKLTIAAARSELVVFILRDLPGWPEKW
ncbi:RNA polymerase III subunit C82 [Saitozyma podzolica]|uniref:DNA-directed RNA polymerase III subunit RPC3 n=1 Tax=Saitozyma podzolica TaxID=1890683 RepID=A0A427XRE5_9TREE|nr:RNA polymerase III subunit C82 [Saitozyma podzolica]